jgi:hypothetical protein
MGSVNHPRVYSPATIEAVRDVFYDVWFELEAHDEPRVAVTDEVKGAIIERLFDLLAEGTTSREKLRNQVLNHITGCGPRGGAESRGRAPF